MTLSFFPRAKLACASGLLALYISLPNSAAAAEPAGARSPRTTKANVAAIEIEPDIDPEPTSEIQLTQELTQATGQPTPAQIPVLPETNVVAEPQPTTQPQQPQPNYDNVAGPSILSGTIFSSPLVTGYNAQSSTVGTFINVPTMMFPGTINTIPSAIIRDQNILTMDDTIRNIPSAVKAYGADGVIRMDQFFVRGFQVTSQNWRKDGYLDPTHVARDVANIERIDVLKGPSSTLYGAAQPTGTFNVVTKKAQINPFATGQFFTGSFGLQRYAVDVNTPLTADGDVLFRINAAYQNSDSFRNTVFSERTFVAPTLTFLLSEDTTLTWSGEYQRDRFRLDNGIPAINGNPFAVSSNSFFGNPDGDLGNYHSYRSTLTLEHQLNDNWTARVGAMSLWYNTPSTVSALDNGTTSGPGGFLVSPVMFRDQTTADPFMEQNHDILETLGGDFDGYLFHHRMVIGAEQDWFITNHDRFTSTLSGIPGTGAFGPANVFGPNPIPLGPPSPFSGVNIFDNPAFRQTRFGYFAQDIIDLTPRLHLLVGGRFDNLRQTYSRSSTTIIPAFGFNQTTGDIHTVDSFNQFSPRVGLTYDVMPDIMSIYGTYARSFTPSVGTVNFTPVALQPQIGDIWEGGVKTMLTQNCMLTTSGYWTRQENVNVEVFNPAAGPGVPAFTVSQAGVVRSQGVEAALNGNLTERLSTFSNFGYNDTLQHSIDPTIDGKRPRSVPHWTGSVWARYNLVQNPVHTFGTALGMIYVGDRPGDYLSQLVLPSYDIWDLGFYYNRGPMFASILWDNIFDKTYAVSSISQYQVFPGTPSNVRLQFGATF